MEEQSLRGGIWESSGSPLGSICLGVIWESFGGLEAEEASGRHLEVRSQKSMPLSAKMQKSFKMLILHCVFEGQITK